MSPRTLLTFRQHTEKAKSAINTKVTAYTELLTAYVSDTLVLHYVPPLPC